MPITGCWIHIKVPEEGGIVTTESGSRRFAYPGTTYAVGVHDYYFDEVFEAVPDPGYRFLGWKSMPRGLCGGSEEPCHIHTAGYDPNPFLTTLVESEETFYLEPVFEKLPGCEGVDPKRSGKKVTLVQGEYAIREIEIKYKTNRVPKSRVEVCPQGMCSTSLNRDRTRDNLMVIDLKIETNPGTPPGKYKVEYITYKGGRACDWFFGCVDNPIKVKKRWKFEVTVKDCPLN